MKTVSHLHQSNFHIVQAASLWKILLDYQHTTNAIRSSTDINMAAAADEAQVVLGGVPAAVKASEHRTFHVPEVLEAILDKLPAKDLLFSTKVCKTWKAAVDGSTRLQRVLFFLPEGPASLVFKKGPKGTSRSILLMMLPSARTDYGRSTGLL